MTDPNAPQPEVEVKYVPPPVLTGCAAGCGAKTTNPTLEAWTYLEITKRYRCPLCTQALTAVRDL